MAQWYENWFDEDYLELYPNRNQDEARRAIHSILPLMSSMPKGPMLDLACGQGRHLTLLSEIYADTFGIDLSLILLKKIPYPFRSQAICANMLQLPVKPSSLSAVFMWFTSFGYFDEADNRAVIKKISKTLKPNGFFLVDLLNEKLIRQSLIHEDTIETDNYRFFNQRRLEGSILTKDVVITRKSTGSQRRIQERLRLYSPEEMTNLMSSSNLRLKLTLGDYDGNSFHPSSPRWIGIYQHS